MNLNKTRLVKSDGLIATLRGEGDFVPELQVTYPGGGSVSAYVDSGDLRKVGAKFIEWADKLDKEEAKA